jgi:hypothetical protein
MRQPPPPWLPDVMATVLHGADTEARGPHATNTDPVRSLDVTLAPTYTLSTRLCHEP